MPMWRPWITKVGPAFPMPGPPLPPVGPAQTRTWSTFCWTTDVRTSPTPEERCQDEKTPWSDREERRGWWKKSLLLFCDSFISYLISNTTYSSVYCTFRPLLLCPLPPLVFVPKYFFYIYMSFAVITFEDLIARKFCWGVSVKVGCMCFSQKTKDGNTFSPSGLHLNENLYAFKTPLNSFFCQRKNKFEFVQWHTPSQKFYVKIVKQDTSA